MILWYTMEDISVEQSTPCVMFKLWSQMASWGWVNALMRSCSLTSKPPPLYSLAAFESQLMLYLSMVQGQERVPSISETVENGTTSWGAFDRMLKWRGYGNGQSGTPVPCTCYFTFIISVTASERCFKCQVGRHQESERCCVGLDHSPKCPTKPTPCA